jgi:Putative Actinobacterial Holin-X, holin superfamily III
MGDDLNRPDPGESTPELATEITDDLQRMATLQLELAKQEVKELAIQNAVAAGMLGAAAVVALLAVLVAVPVLLVVILPWHVQTAAVWMVLYLVLGAVLALLGRSRLRLELPPKTTQTLKENKEWALRRMRSTRS